MTGEQVKALKDKCLQYRKDLITQLHAIQTGHPGGSLSCIEIVTTLYENFLNVDPKNPEMEGRDHFVLSKGHAAPTLYMVLADKGFIPKEWWQTLRQVGSNLQGHPCVHKTPGVELSTGPLGLGLSAGLGMMLADRLKGYDSYTYVLMGDGEIQEGGIWEAAQTAVKYKADHLIGILDNNGVQLDGTNEEIMPLGDVTAKWEAFGWYVIDCDGHDVESFDAAVRKAKEHTGSPVLIRAKTVKGKGVSFMEGQAAWHGKAIDDACFEKAMAELGGEK